jgi:hypothetical protein
LTESPSEDEISLKDVVVEVDEQSSSKVTEPVVAIPNI